MAQIIIEVPDNQVTRVQTALCTTANLAISAANAKSVIVNYIKAVVKRYEAEQSKATNDIAVS